MGREKTIAFQGELGAFSHAAAQKLLGPEVEVKTCETFQDVFNSLANGSVAFAVIPIENTLHGSIHENYDNLLRYKFQIEGEVTVKIAHHLIAIPNVKFRKVNRIFSHPVALNQCRRFFQQHTGLKPVPFYDTAGSVKMLIQEGLTDAAAIASESAAAIYGGRILKRNLQDNPQNFTRFFLLSGEKLADRRQNVTPLTGPWKTSIVFSGQNAPGTLFKALACFALRDLDLVKIESRPLPERPWEYLFYLDILGRVDSPAVSKALLQLQEMATFFRVLGSYLPQPA